MLRLGVSDRDDVQLAVGVALAVEEGEAPTLRLAEAEAVELASWLPVTD